MLADIAAIIAPVFVCAAIGYAWARLDLAFDRETITLIVVNIATPALILSTLAKLEVPAGAFGEVAGAWAAFLATASAIGFVVLKLAGWSARSYLPSLIFSNTGTMGLPLCMFAFGSEGLALGLAVFAVSSATMFVVTPALASGRVDWREALRSPLYYTIAVSVVLMVTGTPLPKWMQNSADLLGGLAIPLLLLTLGVSLAQLRLATFGRSLVLAVLKIVLGWPLQLAALASMVWLLSRDRTPVANDPTPAQPPA